MLFGLIQAMRRQKKVDQPVNFVQHRRYAMRITLWSWNYSRTAQHRKRCMQLIALLKL